MAKVHPTAVVAPAARLGADVDIGPYCVVGSGAVIGDRTRLVSHVAVEGVTQLGADCVAYPFSVLGGPPQHAGHKGDETRLVVGDRALIREHVTLNVGSSVGLGVTTIGDDCTFYAGAHVGHDCTVGDGVLMVNQATLGGHVRLDDHCIVAGLAAVHQNGRVGRCAFVGGLAAVVSDVIPYGLCWGNRARLEGLNLVGLKRRGFSREQINVLRAAYRELFADDGTFQDRVERVAEAYAASPHVMEIVDFIRAADRPLCLPGRD